MTLQELEVLVKELLKQIELNTAAINSIYSRFDSYVTNSTFNGLSTNVGDNNSDISTLKSQVADLLQSIGLINKISKLLDVNIQDLTKDDILLYDGDRWTNISPEDIVISQSAINTLEGLTDVSISGKQDGLAICWDNVSQKWTNKTIQTSGGGSTSGLDVTAMWEELGKATDSQINPSHITGSLNLSGLNVTGDSKLASGDNYLLVSSTKNEVKGDLIGLNEITAYGSV